MPASSNGPPPHTLTKGTYEAALRAHFPTPQAVKPRSYGWSALKVASIILGSVVVATYMANVAVTHEKEQRVIHLLDVRRKLREEEQELRTRMEKLGKKT
ncbi:hypothetical protein BC832DRAFT_595159 [Gaertneriomyces semiglobifer]|nr:hypothetical protein BC832DRAFT_595159 [Gaertneriomyces semiglobifer]